MTVRHRSRGPGPGQWLVLGAAACVILALTFALGILVGRQWMRPAAPPQAAEAGKKPAPPARRGGSAEATAARAPQAAQEKLTFYRTLTAPLGPTAPAARPALPPTLEVSPRPAPPERPASAERPVLPERAERPGGAPPAPEAPLALPPPSPRSATAPAARGAEPRGEWTVQVAFLRSGQQADALLQDLKAAGFDAYVVPARAEDGQTRYRVRVGAYPTREAARAVAARLGAERRLDAFMTAR